MRSISRDITVGLNVTILAAVLLTGLVYYFFRVSQVESELDDKYAKITNNLVGVLAIHLWTFDDEAIRFVGDVYLHSGDVKGIKVTNEAGQEVFRKGQIKEGGSFTLSEDIVYSARKVGRLDIAFTSESLAAARRSILTMAALILLCVVSVSFFATRFMLRRYLSAPLLKLRDDVERLAGGEYGQTLLTDPRIEISKIIQAFNDLSGKLDQQNREVLEKTASLENVNLELFREIEVRREAETALQEAHDTLERRVEERTAELSRSNSALRDEIKVRKKAEANLKVAAEKLGRSNQELQDFAYIASHDLQEPLRKVTVFGDRLKSKYAETLGKQGLDYLERMQRATRRMQTFISDLLAYSRVTTKAKPFVPVDLGKVAGEVLSDLEIRLEESGGRVEVDGLPIIDADPLQMRQLLQNLIGNALKYHKKDEPPVVLIQAELMGSHGPGGHGVDQERCRITIQDNGIGFDQQHAERIFGVFQRLHGRSEYEGSGVGLSICRKIVERHDGGITAQGVPGRGATFTVTLPVRLENREIKDQGPGEPA